MSQTVVHVSDALGTDNISCGGIGSPCQTIQYAASSIAVDNDTILIDTGLYSLATSVNAFTPVVKLPEGKSLNFLGTTTGNGTRIDGGATRRGFLYYYSGTGCNTGTANDGIADTLQFFFKDLIVQNCKITEVCNNTTYAYGGGMRLDCDTGSALFVTITECTFLNNQSYDVPGTFANGRSGSGGAIWVYGIRNGNAHTGTRAEAYISNCVFTGNFANHNVNGGHGGAICLRDLDTASVTNSSFCDNYVFSASADNGDLQHDRNAGGAMIVYDTWNGSPAHNYTIDSCSFINNSALTTNGGSFTNKSEGGAVFLTKGDVLTALSTATLRVSNSNFYNNVVETGIEHIDRNGGTLDTSSIGGNGFFTTFNVDLGDDTTICGTDTFILDATIPGATYLWQDSSTASTFPVIDTSGSFSVTVTVGSCVSEDTIVISVSPSPQFSLGNDTTVCPYDSLLLDVTMVGATYLWMNGSLDSAIYVQDSGLVWVDVTVNGCTTSDSLVLDTINFQQLNLGNDTNICGSDTLLLDAFMPGANYVWQDSSSSSSYPVMDTSGTFSVTVTLGGCSAEDSILIGITPLPMVSIGNDTTLCPYDSLLVDATTPSATYLWMNGSLDSAIYAQDSGLVWVDVTVNGCTTSDSIILDTVSIQQTQLGNDTNSCGLDTILLNASANGASYLWQDGSTNATFSVADTSAAFWVTVTVGACAVSDTITITNVDYPLVNIGPDTTLCPYVSMLLDATTASATYLWNDGSTNPTFSAQGAGLLWVGVTTSGCTTFDSLTTDTVAIQPINLGPDALLCPEETVQLDAAGAGLTYLWNDGSTNSALNVNSPGIYSVIIAKDGCQYGDTLTVNAVDNLQDFLVGPSTACEGETVQLTVIASNVASVQWNDGSTGISKTVTQSGTYIATANRQGCLFLDTSVVAFAPKPTVNLPDSIEKCTGDSVLLDASYSSATYLWNNTATTPSLMVGKTGFHSVVVTLGECSALDGTNVVFKASPVLDLPDSTTVCTGDSLRLNIGNGNAAYNWSHGPKDSIVSVHLPGLYIATVSQGKCVKKDSAYLTVQQIPRFSLGQDRLFCEDDSVFLAAKLQNPSLENLSYNWKNGAGEAFITTHEEGVYWLTIDHLGCAFSDTIQLRKKYPPGYLLGNDTTVCRGDSLHFAFNDSTVSFTWMDSVQSSSASFAAPELIYLEAMNDCGSSVDSLILSERECECFVYLPNAVTPDGDIFNETFEMKYTCDMYNFIIRIYDRWGELVFESRNPDFNWDLHFEGLPLPIGIYAYQLEYDAQLRANGSRVHSKKVGALNVLR